MRYFFHENVRFCPRCGIQRLQRDMDRQGGHMQKGDDYAFDTERA